MSYVFLKANLQLFFFSDAVFFFFCATGGEILMHTQQGL